MNTDDATAKSEASNKYYAARVEYYRSLGHDYDHATRCASEDANLRDWSLGD